MDLRMRGLAVALAAVAAVAPASARGESLALVGGRIIDGYGGPVIENGVILVAGERIVAVGREGELAVPSGVTVVDANGHDGASRPHRHARAPAHRRALATTSAGTNSTERAMRPT
jgi:hypothetical protein